MANENDKDKMEEEVKGAEFHDLEGGENESEYTEIVSSDSEESSVVSGKRNLNKTLVIVGTIVLLAVLVMAGILIKNYMDNSKNSIAVDKNFYTAFFYATKQQIEQKNAFKSPAEANAYWADPKNVDVLKKQTIDYVRKNTLIIEKAKNDGFTLTPAVIEKTKTDFTTSYMGQYKTLENIEFEIQKNYHISFEQLKQIIVDMTLINNYQTEQPIKLAKLIPDAEAKAYYDANLSKFKTVKVRHILLLNTDAKTKAPLTGAKLVAVEKKANDILAMVKKGDNMEKLALKYSQDTPGVITNKGIYDVTVDAQLVPEFKNWALSGKLNDSAVVKTQYGFHVMRVESINTLNFEVSKATIKETMAKEKFKTDLDIYTATLKNISNQSELDKVLPLPVPENVPTALPAVVPTTVPQTVPAQ